MTPQELKKEIMEEFENKLAGDFAAMTDEGKIHYDPKQWYSENNYKIMPYKTNDPETWEAGDIIQDEDGRYRTVFIAQGTGDIRTFDLSYKDKSLDNDRLKKHCSTYTAFELKKYGYTIYTPEEKPVYTPDEAIDKLRELGHDCEIKK